MAGGAAGRRAAAALVVVLALWPACGCSRVRQWREARASAAAAASASAADAALYERLKNIVPDDVDVCDLMSAGDTEAILGQQLRAITFSRHTYDEGRVALSCYLRLTAGTPYESFPTNTLEIMYDTRSRERELMEEVNAFDGVSNARPVTAHGLEGEGAAYEFSSNYGLIWRYPDGYTIRFRMDKTYSVPPRDPTDTILIPLLQRITTTVHTAASGPTQNDTVYPPRPTTPPATPTSRTPGTTPERNTTGTDDHPATPRLPPAPSGPQPHTLAEPALHHHKPVNERTPLWRV